MLCALASRTAPPPPRAAVRTRLRGHDGAPLDDALVLWFPAPSSVTGEDVAEFHVHGGRAVVAGVLTALAMWGEARPAEPGEFTRRAFENGKLDLTQAEAIADLVDADTAAQRRQALRQLGGELGRLYEAWRGELIGALAYLEAHLDFPDEDLPDTLPQEVDRAIQPLMAAMESHLADHARGERIREGFHVAVVGPPNVGKSSLINALARRDVAIVSPWPGTTRDVIHVPLDLGGYAVVLSDTAGLRETENEIEQEGIHRARREARLADLVLRVRDPTSIAEGPASLGWTDVPRLDVLNKSDLGGSVFPGEIAVSARTGAGLPALVAALAEAATGGSSAEGAPTLTRARHRAAVSDALMALQRASRATAADLQAEDLRMAARALGRITGRVGVEDVLDVVFTSFCLGK